MFHYLRYFSSIIKYKHPRLSYFVNKDKASLLNKEMIFFYSFICGFFVYEGLSCKYALKKYNEKIKI